MEDFSPLQIGGGLLFLLGAWLLWRRARAATSPPPPPPSGPTGPPRSLAEIKEFARQVKAAEARRQQVLRDGLRAPARILAVEETGVAQHDRDEDDDGPVDPLDNRPQVRVSLHVQPVGAASFAAELTEFVSREQLARLQPGRSVSVRYDPSDPTGVALDPAGA